MDRGPVQPENDRIVSKEDVTNHIILRRNEENCQVLVKQVRRLKVKRRI